MSLNEVLRAFRDEVTAFASTSVVQRGEGTAIASVSEEGVDAEAGDAYLAEMVKQHTLAQKALSLSGETEDLVLQTAQGLALARPLAGTAYVWTLLTGPQANLALTRAVMRKYQERVVQALPQA